MSLGCCVCCAFVIFFFCRWRRDQGHTAFMPNLDFMPGFGNNQAFPVPNNQNQYMQQQPVSNQGPVNTQHPYYNSNQYPALW
jgi:hypothetical protein